MESKNSSIKYSLSNIPKVSLNIFYALLGYMPLHIFLSTWLGTSFGVLEFAKVFKDVVLVLGFGLALSASIGQPWFKPLLKDRLLWLIGGYALLTLLLAGVMRTDLDAEILGIVYNLRFLLFFLYGWLLAGLFDARLITRRAVQVVLIVGVVVAAFGVLQHTVLPSDSLTHAGYSRANGVLPVFFIDNKPDLERVMSTVRDPNSLGSYLIIILSITLAYLATTKNKQLKQTGIGLAALSVLCLYFTFSRSAWLGAVFAVGALVVLLPAKAKSVPINQKYIIAAVVAAVIGLAYLYIARDSYLVQNIIFHSDEQTVLEDPNELRLRFWQTSIAAALLQPHGFGPGTAGLASIRNDIQGTVLNENYYLQILYEIGVLGLLLFLSILGYTAVRLYQIKKPSPLILGLIASFAGLAVTNFLVHIWSNEAVAYTWWGLAGLVIVIHRRRDTRRARVR